VPEEEETISVDIGFRDVEVGPEEGNEDGIEEVVHEFMEDLHAFVEVREGEFSV
jgi:hypothetical protein